MSGVITAPREDARVQDIHALVGPTNPSHGLETVGGTLNETVFRERACDKARVEPGAYFSLPGFRWDQPFALLAFTLAPARPIRRRLCLDII